MTQNDSTTPDLAAIRERARLNRNGMDGYDANHANDDRAALLAYVAQLEQWNAAEQAVIEAAEALYLHEESVAPEDRSNLVFFDAEQDLILSVCDAVDALRKARTA